MRHLRSPVITLVPVVAMGLAVLVLGTVNATASGTKDRGGGQAVDALVSVGSPTTTHPQNAQPEPPLAVDPTRPNVLVSGANDLVDMQPCSQNWSDSFGISVSHIDNVTPSRILDQRNWSRPHLVPGRPGTISDLDKPQIWADNATSSPYFGHTYVCYDDYGSLTGSFPIYINVGVSTDGGLTWVRNTIGGATHERQGFYDGCTVRTDSHGVVYVFYEHFGVNSLIGAHTLVKSFDGGKTWTKQADVVPMTETCFQVDPVTGNCPEDGTAGARAAFGIPSIDIANGSPTGADATNEIVDAWPDGRVGPGTEKTMVATSMDGGTTWSVPSAISLAGDRPMYAAPSISPDGKRVYVVYMGYLQPFQTTTDEPRLTHGVMRTASIGAAGLPTGWTTVYNGPSGDARGSSQGRILYNEFLGDYVYAIATRTYGAGVWTDVRRSVNCPAVDAWRQASWDAGEVLFPAPWVHACPANFGNSDIYSASTG